jgi:hypothetical protein
VFEDGTRWLVALVNYSYLDKVEIEITVPEELLAGRRGQETQGKKIAPDSTKSQQVKRVSLEPSGVGFVTFQKESR